MFVSCLLFLVFFLGMFVQNTAAAAFPPGKIPCDEVENPEFQSLRPYQKNPCDKKVHDTALFCGNDLVLSDIINVNKSQAESCTSIGGGKEKCHFVYERPPLEIAIDLSGADLPIAGNTELVINSQNFKTVTDLDDATKVNEYLSWYLNGAINRAEYPLLGAGEDDTKKLTTFSGPLNKLLPWNLQAYYRIKTITDGVLSRRGAEEIRHDQIVACTIGLEINILIFSINIGRIPIPCYIDRSALNKFFTGIKRFRLSSWADHTPPVEEDYDEFYDYWIQYKRWRGNYCPEITLWDWVPILGGKRIVLCYDDPLDLLRPNFWSQMFTYIPFSSTEDRKGQVRVQSVGVTGSSGDVQVYDIDFSNQIPASLFFSHMQENNELAGILQKTFAPQGAKLENPFAPGLYPNEHCDLAQIRTNPGDNLFAGEIKGDLTYTAEFDCEFEPDIETSRTCSLANRCPDRMSCRSGKCWIRGTTTCTQDIAVSLGLITKTPLAEEIWQKTVAGPSAIIKQFFPKMEKGAPIEAMYDIPAATKVNYSGANLVSAGNPGNQRDGESAELYFPHLGSVKEYFLGCLQTLLRPQGFGEQCNSRPIDDDKEPTNCEDVPDSEIANIEGGKWLGSMKENFLRLADETPITACEGSENNLAEECYNLIIRESDKADLNPAFTLAIWLHETTASNSCLANRVYDLGVDKAGLERNVPKQLEAFVKLPYTGIYWFARNQDGWTDEFMQAFLHVFSAGNTSPDPDPADYDTAEEYEKAQKKYEDGQNYYANFMGHEWVWVTEPLRNCTTSPIQKFGIEWPTDRSCP